MSRKPAAGMSGRTQGHFCVKHSGWVYCQQDTNDIWLVHDSVFVLHVCPLGRRSVFCGVLLTINI